MPVFKLSSPLPPSLPSLPPSLPPFLPVEESLPLEHGVKLAPDPLPGLLDRRAVAHKGQGHLRGGGREGRREGGVSMSEGEGGREGKGVPSSP